MTKFSEYIRKTYTLYDKNCIYCGDDIKKGSFVCEDCRKKEIKPYEDDKVIAALCYDGIVKDLIHRFKYGERPYIALYIAQRCADIIKEKAIKADILTFVPVHKKRKSARGFDQCHLTAIYLSEMTGITLKPLLKRVKNTKAQFSLSPSKRAENMKDAFEFFGDEDIKGKKILLFDDIYTTGATMKECCRTLEERGCNIIKFAFSK